MTGGRLRSTILAVGATALLLAATSLVSAHDTPAPPLGAPPTVDNSRISDKPMPVAGPDGEWIRCPDGELLEVTPREWLNAPNLGRAERSEESDADHTIYRVTEPVVARCGPGGGGADGQPVFVPESAADGVVAPQRFLHPTR